MQLILHMLETMLFVKLMLTALVSDKSFGVYLQTQRALCYEANN